jgi:hypothetical protein
MGSELFEVGLYNPNAGAGESVMIPRVWDAGTIVKSVRGCATKIAKAETSTSGPRVSMI